VIPKENYLSMTSQHTLYSDGGARGNPGPAAIGVVIKSDSSVVAHISHFIGRTTNNQAEYRALLAGLERARDLKIQELSCFLDSALVVNQLNGLWRVKDPGLAPLFLKAWNLKQHFRRISFTHVARQKNKEADRLVNQALDKEKKS
jgi:ribonuclease HI